MRTATELKNIVKETYGNIARQSVTSGSGTSNDRAKIQQTDSSCCGSVPTSERLQQVGGSCCGAQETSFLAPDYSSVDGHYAEADLGLGCGVPTRFADIAEGQTVLDLGSGDGNDVFVARSIVGETGKVIGVDMTEPMIARAEENRRKLGYENVEFRSGDIENLPVTSTEVDVVISNCVLNLVPDKNKAFQEIYRALKPGGHFCISDIVLRGELPDQLKRLAELYAGCVAGAMQRDEYLNLIRDTGFLDIQIKKEQQFVVTDALLTQYLKPEDIDLYRQSNAGVYSITVFARKPIGD